MQRRLRGALCLLVRLINHPQRSKAWFREPVRGRPVGVYESEDALVLIRAHHHTNPSLGYPRDCTRRTQATWHALSVFPMPSSAPPPTPPTWDVQRQIHLAFRMAQRVSALLNQVVGWDAASESQGVDRWETHEISERLRKIGGEAISRSNQSQLAADPSCMYLPDLLRTVGSAR